MRTTDNPDVRLLPVLCCLGLVVALSAANIGQARLQGMERDLAMQDNDFNVAVMVFYIPCVVAAVPANLVFQHSRPSWFLSSTATLSGVIAIAQGLTQSYAGLLVCRLLLGLFVTAFEAGALYLLTSYYLQRRLHKRITLFLSTRLGASAFGGLLAYAIAKMDGLGSLQGWRWILVLEGLITSVVGLASIFFLPDWPEQVKSYQDDEDDTMTAISEDDDLHDASKRQRSSVMLRRVLCSPLLYFSGVIHFCCKTLDSSAAIFTPSILRSFKWTPEKVHYMTVPILLPGIAVALLLAAYSDRIGKRYPFCAGGLTLTVAACIVLLKVTHISVWVSYGACIVWQTGTFAADSTSMAWLANNIRGRRLRGMALGCVAMLGNCGFILGSNIFLERQRPEYQIGYGTNLAASALAVLAATAQVVYLWHRCRSAWEEERKDCESMQSDQSPGITIAGEKNTATRIRVVF